MPKIPLELKERIARNIKECRLKKFPGRGGAKKCAEAFGVSPQQWSPWEKGYRTPDETRMSQLAMFFGVTVECLRRDNSPPVHPEPGISVSRPAVPLNDMVPAGMDNDGWMELMHSALLVVKTIMATEKAVAEGRLPVGQATNAIRQIGDFARFRLSLPSCDQLPDGS